MAVVIVALSGCGYGLQAHDCNPDADLDATATYVANQYDIKDVVERMDLRCYDDVSGYLKCRRDVDACTIELGSYLDRGLSYAGTWVMPSNVVCHEAQHWALWGEDNACASHSPTCGWVESRVSDCNHLTH